MARPVLADQDLLRPKPKPWRGMLMPRGYDILLRRHFGLRTTPWQGPKLARDST